jgi:hypothetical protein
MFQLFTNDQREKISAETAAKIEKECHLACPNDGSCTGICDGCSIGLNHLFKIYISFLDSALIYIVDKYRTEMKAKLNKSFSS